MKKALLALSILFFAISHAQVYNQAFGLRGGTGNGFTYKQFLAEQAAGEVLVSISNVGVYGAGLYEIHKKAFNNDQWTWHYGIGGHFISVRGTESFFGVGVSAVAGLDYTIPDFPITFSLNTIPDWTLIGNQGMDFTDMNFSIRYIIH